MPYMPPQYIHLSYIIVYQSTTTTKYILKKNKKSAISRDIFWNKRLAPPGGS
ncbi:hypothetical protein TREAZ_3629 [Leadbettera azotonutricia ZAS-9]|uniref:Uncharacterized protein n=1 Tax=Leadbettera azotonutricia (strain ATCC BAA-888 / DSM 13862 / ZAS-9) TaxID=545695 RepID=F5YGB1_LEAAZ|nr:hypothetical protein TREAZ_3629 [Leadbettera azotonutricia ZAS-9]